MVRIGRMNAIGLWEDLLRNMLLCVNTAGGVHEQSVHLCVDTPMRTT